MTNLTVQEITQILFDSLAALNQERSPDRQIPVSESTTLMGTGTHLDSLGFIMFLTDVEERLSASGEEIQDLFALELFGAADTPFRDVASLARHLEAHLRTEGA